MALADTVQGYLDALFSTEGTIREAAAQNFRTLIPTLNEKDRQTVTNSLILVVNRAKTNDTRELAEGLLGDPSLRLTTYLEVAARDKLRPPEVREIALRMLVPHAAMGANEVEVARLAIKDETTTIALQGVALARALKQEGWPLLRQALTHHSPSVIRAAAQAAYDQRLALSSREWLNGLAGDAEARQSIINLIFADDLAVDLRLWLVEQVALWPELSQTEQKILGQTFLQQRNLTPQVQEALLRLVLPKVPDTSPARQSFTTTPMRAQTSPSGAGKPDKLNDIFNTLITPDAPAAAKGDETTPLLSKPPAMLTPQATDRESEAYTRGAREGADPEAAGPAETVEPNPSETSPAQTTAAPTEEAGPTPPTTVVTDQTTALPTDEQPTIPLAASVVGSQTTEPPQAAPTGAATKTPPFELQQTTSATPPFGLKGADESAPSAVVYVTQPAPSPEHYYACHLKIYPSTTDRQTVVEKISLETHGLEQDEQPEADFKLDAAYLLEQQLEGNVAYGHALFNTLFAADNLRQAYHLVFNTAQAAQAPLHLRLEIHPALAEYHLMQWEYVYDADESRDIRFWAGNPNTPFSRLLPFAKDPPPLETVEALRVLFVVANPANLGDANGRETYLRLAPLNLPTELALIENAVKALQTELAAHNLQIYSQVISSDKMPVTLATLHSTLAEAQAAGKPFHIVHIVAHGILRGGVHQIILENNQHQATPHDEGTFAREFETEYGVRLVVLVSCLSGRQTNADAYRGLAAQLVRQNIPAVIAMMQKVSMATAYAFTQLFYSNLAYHGTVDRALNAARRALYGGDDWNFTADEREWAVPLLFLRLPDGRLFNTGQPAHTLQAPEFSPARWQAPPTVPPPDLQKAVNTLITEMGDRLAQSLSLSFAQQRSLEQRLLEVASAPPPTTNVATRPQLFSAETAKREKLVTLAQAYRRQAHRWPVLLVRRQARRQQLKQLLDPAWFTPANWQTFTTQAQVTVDTQVWPMANLPPAAPPANAREIRQLIRRSPKSLQFQGNLSWVLPIAPDLPDPVWVQAVVQGLGTVLDKWKAYEQNAVQPAYVMSGLLHWAAPDEALPYAPEFAQAIQQALSLQEAPDYTAYLRLAQDLLADVELGLTKLDDVFYFLQHLAAQVLLPVPAATTLVVDSMDSRLELPEETFPSLTAAINAAKHVILIGPPGTGKTTLAEDVARHAWDSGLSAGFVSVTATADWTTFDTIGGYMPDASGQLRFKPGVFLRAIRDNQWLIIDEINRADIDKAFGELFTVLSGQGVTLPYEQGGQPVRILPAGQTSKLENDYALPVAWRIIGTMNVYDKASLFTMSSAFMRRFAFVDVDIPPKELYDYLIQSFIRQHPALENYDTLARCVQELFDASNEELWPLMNHRALGPAIAQDIVRYLAERRPALDRHRKLDNAQDRDYRALAEAFNLYAAPQLDGLEEQVILQLYRTLRNRFGPNLDTLKLIQDRIRGLFPHIRRWG